MSQTEPLVLPVDTTQVKDGAKALDGLTAAGGRAQRATDALRPSFAAFGAAAGAAAGAVALMTKNAIDAADAMNDLHIKTGIAFKSLAAYDLLARQSGTTIQGMAQGVKFLSRYMVEHGDKLKSIGVTSKDTNVAMMQFADVISRIEDPATRTALAMEVLGRSGDELIPSLINGSKGFRDAETATAAYGAALERAAPMADEFNDMMEVAKTKAKTFGLNMAGEVLPVLISSAKYFTSTSEKVGGFSLAATAAVGTLKALAITVAGIGTAAQIAGVALGGAAAMAMNPSQAGTIWKAMGDDVAKATSDLRNFRDELSAGVAATEKAEEGTKKLTAEEEKRIKAMLVGKKEQDDATKKALEWIKALNMQTAQMGLAEDQKKSLEAATLALTVKDAALRAEIMRTVAAFTAQANAIEMASVAARENNRIVSEFLDAEEEEQKKVTSGIRGLREKVEAMKEEEFALTATTEQLREHNIQRELEKSGLDKASEAYAEMEKRLREASDSLSMAKEAKKATDEQVKMWERIEGVAHDTFVSIFDSGKSAFDRLRDVLKNGLYSLLYQMTVKPFVIQLAATFGGQGVAGALGAAGGGGIANIGSSVLGSSTWMANMAAEGVIGGTVGMIDAGITAIGAGNILGGLSSLAGPVGAAIAIGGALGLFGKKRQIKPSQLGLMQGQNDRSGAAYQDYLRISQIDVPGGDQNLPLYIAYEEKLNAAIKQGLVNKEKLNQIVGQYFTGGANESAESMLQRLDAMLDGLGAGTEDIAENSALAAAKRELELRVMEMSGEAIGALKIRREEELKAADESLRPLMEQIYALEDQSRANEEAARASEEAARASEEAAAAAERAAQAERDLQDQRLESVSIAEAQLDSAMRALQAAVQAERDSATVRRDLEKGRIEEQINAVSDSIARLSSLSGALRTTLDSLGIGPSRMAAQAQVSAAIAIARAGGPLPSLESLDPALRVLAKPTTDLFQTFEAYQRDFMRTANDIETLNALTEEQGTVEEKTLATLKDQADSIDEWYRAEMSRLDDVLSAAEMQVNAIMGVDASVKSVGLAIAALGAAIQNVTAARESYALSTAGSTQGRINDASRITSGTDWYTYGKQMNERYGDQGIGIALQQMQAAGKTMSEIDALYQFPAGTVEQWADQRGIRKFHDGTDFVPRTGMAMLKKGERVVSETNNRELIALLEKTEKNTRDTLALFRGMTDDGQSIRTVAA